MFTIGGEEQTSMILCFIQEKLNRQPIVAMVGAIMLDFLDNMNFYDGQKPFVILTRRQFNVIMKMETLSIIQGTM